MHIANHKNSSRLLVYLVACSTLKTILENKLNSYYAIDVTLAYRTRGFMKFSKFWTDEWAVNIREALLQKSYSTI